MEPKKVLKLIVFVLVAGNLALLAYVLSGAFDHKPEPMANPNGYDDLVKALAVLHGNPVNYQKMTLEELEELAGANTQAMSLLETGISNKCRVTNDYSPAGFNNVVFPHLTMFKQCGYLFCAEGRLAELEGRTNDAIQFYLEGIRFGQDCSQGGVFIEKLVGIACQAIAEKPLENLLTNLDAKQCAQITREIESIDAQEETDEQALRHENDFARINGGIKGQFARLVMFKSIRQTRERFLAKLHTAQLHRRMLAVAFAARAYELEKGKPPADAAALVPDYLKQIPKDPTTGTNLVLQAAMNSR